MTWSRQTKMLLVVGAVLALIAVGIFTMLTSQAPTPVVEEEPEVIEEEVTSDPRKAVIGTSVEGRAIESFMFGDGEKHLLFVGGIHGGYEWNSVLLAYEFIDHLTINPETLPEDVTVSVIPSLNPDGVYAVIGTEGRFTFADVPDDAGPVGTGRFNANDVDLNRNFDCKWQPESSWRGNTVSAGTGAFSEPEAIALRDFVTAHNPEAVVFWHSQADAVYASECENGVLPETLAVMNTYADAAGYRSVPSFDAYPVTGDAEGWLASLGIPAITVELATHETLEWQKNLSGSTALIEYYSEASGLSR